jgi:protein tyrosine/serine phosphatase
VRGPAEILCNFHWISDGEAARSAQGVGSLLASVMKRNHIRSLINLRGKQTTLGWWHREEAICARLSIARFDALLDSRRLPTRAMLVQLVELLEKAPAPMLVKCSGGQDRASLAAALFLLSKSGWSALAKAQKQFAHYPYLHFPQRTQRWLEQFPRFVYERARGRALGAYIRDDYDPEDFASWLRNNRMGDRFSGVFTLPWRPHRSRLRFWESREKS